MSILNPHGAMAPPSVIHDREIRSLAYRISSPLHYCIGTAVCPHDALCDMCLNAARLCIQQLAPQITGEVLDRIHGALGYRCPGPHPGSDS